MLSICAWYNYSFNYAFPPILWSALHARFKSQY